MGPTILPVQIALDREWTQKSHDLRLDDIDFENDNLNNIYLNGDSLNSKSKPLNLLQPLNMAGYRHNHHNLQQILNIFEVS